MASRVLETVCVWCKQAANLGKLIKLHIYMKFLLKNNFIPGGGGARL